MHIKKIQVFQSKILRIVNNAQWFVRNEALNTDFKPPESKLPKKNLPVNVFDQLNRACCAQILPIQATRLLSHGSYEDVPMIFLQIYKMKKNIFIHIKLYLFLVLL